MQQADDCLWDVRSVAEYLNVSASWVYHAVGAGLLPHMKVGALVRFDPGEVRAWVRRRRAGSGVTAVRNEQLKDGEQTWTRT